MHEPVAMACGHGIGSLRAGKAHGHASAPAHADAVHGVDDAVQEAIIEVLPGLHEERVSGCGSPDFGMLQWRISALRVRWGSADLIVVLAASLAASASASTSAIGDA
jgi:hypothetical protein